MTALKSLLKDDEDTQNLVTCVARSNIYATHHFLGGGDDIYTKS